MLGDIHEWRLATRTLSKVVIFLHGSETFVDEGYSAGLQIGSDTLDHRDLVAVHYNQCRYTREDSTYRTRQNLEPFCQIESPVCEKRFSCRLPGYDDDGLLGMMLVTHIVVREVGGARTRNMLN